MRENFFIETAAHLNHAHFHSRSSPRLFCARLAVAVLAVATTCINVGQLVEQLEASRQPTVAGAIEVSKIWLWPGVRARHEEARLGRSCEQLGQSQVAKYAWNTRQHCNQAALLRVWDG